MVGTKLVDDQIHDAGTLVKQLDADGLSPTLAVWHYSYDTYGWRLLIASPSIDTLLSASGLAAYKRVVDALKSAGPLSLGVADIKLVRTDVDLARAIGSLIETEPDGTASARFSNTTLDGIFIPEMVVLRSAPTP